MTETPSDPKKSTSLIHVENNVEIIGEFGKETNKSLADIMRAALYPGAEVFGGDGRGHEIERFTQFIIASISSWCRFVDRKTGLPSVLHFFDDHFNLRDVGGPRSRQDANSVTAPEYSKYQSVSYRIINLNNIVDAWKQSLPN